jgi:hypothetical protein
MFPTKQPRRQQEDGGEVLRCSFCNRNQYDVRKLIAGPNVFICDECVGVCADIIAQDVNLGGSAGAVDAGRERQPAASDYSGPATAPCALCRMPTPPGDLLPIRDRGALCPRCVGEIEAAAAEDRES